MARHAPAKGILTRPLVPLSLLQTRRRERDGQVTNLAQGFQRGARVPA